jgi:hypothetical protein
MTSRAIIWVTCAIALAASTSAVLALQTDKTEQPAAAASGSPHAAIAGQWHFNKELSTPPADMTDDSASGGNRAPAGRGGFGGGFGGRRGGFGGGRGGSYGGGTQVNSEDMLKMRELTRELMDAPQLLTVVVSSDAVSFTDEHGGSHKFRTDGKKEQIEFGPGTKVDTKTKWDGNTLSQEFSTGRMKLTETYQLTVDNKLLVATIQRSGDQATNGRGQSTPIKFVYQRAE